MSLDAVKTHLRVLFHKFGIDGLPQNTKRVRLVEIAIEYGHHPRQGGVGLTSVRASDLRRHDRVSLWTSQARRASRSAGTAAAPEEVRPRALGPGESIGQFLANARQVAEYYHPALRMDGTPLRLGVSEGGGACGEWTELDGAPTVVMTGQHTVSRKHE